jgi:hypothetical protein
MDNGGCSYCASYRVIGWQEVSSQGKEGSGGETSMASVMGDGNVEGATMGCGHF